MNCIQGLFFLFWFLRALCRLVGSMCVSARLYAKKKTAKKRRRANSANSVNSAESARGARQKATPDKWKRGRKRAAFELGARGSGRRALFAFFSSKTRKNGPFSAFFGPLFPVSYPVLQKYFIDCELIVNIFKLFLKNCPDLLPKTMRDRTKNGISCGDHVVSPDFGSHI